MEHEAGAGVTESTARPRLAIVIVTWNCREMALECIESLRDALEAPAQIIVVDNDSADGSADAVEERYPNVEVVRNGENRGFAGGVNVGLGRVRADRILLLNPDARLQGDVLRQLMRHLDEHPGVGIVGPTILEADGARQPSYFRFPSLRGLVLTATYLYKLFPRSRLFNWPFYGSSDPGRVQSVEVVSGAAFLFRRALLDQIGPFDERYFMYAEEADFCFRARAAGWDVHYVPARSVVHVGGGSSRLQSKKMLVQMRKSILLFFEKHRGRVSAACARGLQAMFLAARIPYWAFRGAFGRSGARREASVQLDNYRAGLSYLLWGREPSD
jgi:hypothetical protein